MFCGVAWSVLNPLLMMIVMSIVFRQSSAQGRNGSVTPDVSALPGLSGNVTFSVMSESDEPGTDVYHLGVLVAGRVGQSASLGVPGAEGVVVLASSTFSFSLVSAVALVMLFFRVVPLCIYFFCRFACLLSSISFCMGLGNDAVRHWQSSSVMVCICGALLLLRGCI